MKSVKLVLTAVAFMTASLAYTQRVNRGDVCQEIPNLTAQQRSEINKLSTQHQKTMDALRTQFRSEPDVAIALDIKTKMITEQNNHYQVISNLLTADQKIWFDQQCLRYIRQSNGLGRGQGYGRGYGRGPGYGKGYRPVQAYCRGYGRGLGYGHGHGYGCGRGYGRGPVY